MKPKLIKHVGEVTVLYKKQSDHFDLSNTPLSKYPFDIVNEEPWSINFSCYECGTSSRIFEYDPSIAIRTPVQSKFLRLVPCYSKFYDLDSLIAIASSFSGLEVYENDEFTIVGPKIAAQQLSFRKKANLAYSRCEDCSQEYLAHYEFHIPDNDRKEKPDPMICEIHDIIQTDIYFEKDIDHYIKLRNLK